MTAGGRALAYPRPGDQEESEHLPAIAPGAPASDPRDLGWRVVETTLIVLALFVLAALLWFAADVLLLLFAAVLIATLMRAATNGVTHLTGLPDGAALALVILVALAVLVGSGLILVPQIASQGPELVDNLGRTLDRLQRRLGLADVTQELTSGVKLKDLLPSPVGLLGSATNIISSGFGVIANAVIVVVIGVYLAADPDLYLRGLVHLVPRSRRQMTRELFEAVGHTLRWWMVGQLVTMTTVGVLSYVALRVLGVPLALILGVLVFMLTFIPFIGAIVAAIPVVLVAFSEGTTTGLYAFAVYAAIEMFEGYVLSPLVQRHSVSLPPALMIAAQVLLGVLLGVLGIALATPLAAMTMVAVNRLYVEELLGDDAGRP